MCAEGHEERIDQCLFFETIIPNGLGVEPYGRPLISLRSRAKTPFDYLEFCPTALGSQILLLRDKCNLECLSVICCEGMRFEQHFIPPAESSALRTGRLMATTDRHDESAYAFKIAIIGEEAKNL